MLLRHVQNRRSPIAHVLPAALARKRLSNHLPNVLVPTSYPVLAMTKRTGVKWIGGFGKKTNRNQRRQWPTVRMMPMMRMPLKKRLPVNQRKVVTSHRKPVPGVGGDDVAEAVDATVGAVKNHPPRTLTTPPTPTHPKSPKMT